MILCDWVVTRSRSRVVSSRYSYTGRSGSWHVAYLHGFLSAVFKRRRFLLLKYWQLQLPVHTHRHARMLTFSGACVCGYVCVCVCMCVKVACDICCSGTCLCFWGVNLSVSDVNLRWSSYNWWLASCVQR